MRFLVSTILTLLTIWSGYWLVGERMIEARIGALLAAKLPGELVVGQSGFNVAGFPNRFDLTVKEPAVNDVTTGWGWGADFAQVFAMTWKPWHLIAALPTKQRLRTPYGEGLVTSDRFMASVLLEPSAEGALAEAVLEVQGAALTGAFLPEMGANSLVVALKRDQAAPFAYRFGLQGDKIRALVPKQDPMDTARLDAVLILTGALDRKAMDHLPEVTAITLHAVSMTRGTVRINGAGQILRNAEGFAEGQVEFTVAGWRDLPSMLTDFGLMRPEIGPAVQKGLESLAIEQGNPTVLQLPLVFSSGRSFLAGQFIGRAPILLQRQ